MAGFARLLVLGMTTLQLCIQQGAYSKPQKTGKPVCLLSQLENGYYVGSEGKQANRRVKPGHFIEARCELGYARRGPQFRHCNRASKEFEEEPPTCEDINECNYSYLSDLSSGNTTLESSSDSYSSESEGALNIDLSTLPEINCHFFAECVNTLGSFRCECDDGYEGDGTHCQKKVPKACEPLEPPLHGSMTGDPTSLLRFTCAQGYRIYGASTRRCVDGRWNGLHPRCEVVGCGDPGTPINGLKIGDRYDVGNRVFFRCDAGHELVGPRERVCIKGDDDQWSDDFWTGVQPTCRQIDTSVGSIATNIKTNFIDHLEVYTHSGRGRLAVSDSIGLDLVFAYDTSTSLNHVNFQRGVNFTESLLKQFGVSYDDGGTRVAVISFADVAEIEFTYGPDVDTFEKVMERINRLKDKLGGGTALGDALARVFDVIKDMRNGSKRALFVMTDGLTTIGQDPAAFAESLRRDEQMEVFVVAVGEGIDRHELRQIASQPYSTHVFLLENFEDLAQLTQIISEKNAEYVRCGQAGNLELPYRGEDQQEEKHNANPRAWPWLAQILTLAEDGPLLKCGGALLCEDWIVTSGSCVCNGSDFIAMPPEQFRVRLGAYELGVREDSEQEFGVSEVHLHTDYDPYNRFNDIALLKLNQSANLTSSVRTLCVQSEIEVFRLRSSSACYIAGWGIVDPIKDEAKNDSMPSVFVQQLKLPLVINDNTCKSRMQHPFPFDKRKMCAGARYRIHEACRGDRGSPLVCQQIDGSWAAAGVASYSRECTEFNKHAVFTRLSDFGPWLQGRMGNCTAAYEAVTVGGFQQKP